MLLGGKLDPDDLKFSRATVVENKEASADGSVRTLVLSIEDHVNFMDGRKIRHVQENPRWVDAYQAPGQFVAVRYCSGGSSMENSGFNAVLAKQLKAIASSPYEARRDSANLDATIIELLVSRNGDEDDRVLAELGPGGLLEVSNVVGKGYAPLFETQTGLSMVLEECKTLLMVALGCRGIAPLHAALTWTPVQAHATANKVILLYAVESQTSAAYLVEWDAWREAGVVVVPIYLSPEAGGSGSNGGGAAAASSPGPALEQALFHSSSGEHGLRGLLGCEPRDAAVLMSGVPGELAAQITRRLTQAGVPGERVMFCEYL
ncbi:hypothetical protein N2152v2_004029 [Parachlorella kessleri]